MGTQSYYDQLGRMSLPELQALNEILADDPYPDRGRQISETRDNIRVIEECIAKKNRA